MVVDEESASGPSPTPSPARKQPHVSVLTGQNIGRRTDPSIAPTDYFAETIRVTVA
jgi:hypothetical protein